MATSFGTKPGFGWLVTAGVAAIAGAALFRAGASSMPVVPGPSPSVVGLIDLTLVTKGLNEIKDRNAALNTRAADFQKQLDDVSAQLNKINEEIKLLPAESKERRKKVFDGLELEQSAKAKQQILRKTIELEAGEILSDMYKKVTETAAKVAGKDGYSLILLDDRSVSLPKDAPDEEINRAIFAKRVLFAAESVDLTQRIITEMNNEYGAPAPRAGAAPAPAPAPKNGGKPK